MGNTVSKYFVDNSLSIYSIPFSFVCPSMMVGSRVGRMVDLLIEDGLEESGELERRKTTMGRPTKATELGGGQRLEMKGNEAVARRRWCLFEWGEEEQVKELGKKWKGSTGDLGTLLNQFINQSTLPPKPTQISYLGYH